MKIDINTVLLHKNEYAAQWEESWYDDNGKMYNKTFQRPVQECINNNKKPV